MTFRIVLLICSIVVLYTLKVIPAYQKYIYYDFKEFDPKYCVKFEKYSEEEVRYFKEIVLKTENGLYLKYLSKYTEDVQIFIEGYQPDYIKKELSKILSDLNSIIDPIDLRVTEIKSQSNLIVSIGSLHNVRKRYPIFHSIVFDNCRGGFVIGNDNLSHCFLNTDNIETAEIAKHVLREEITQALGLPNDSWAYPNSIFYQGGSTVTHYADIDKKLISMLYN